MGNEFQQVFRFEFCWFEKVINSYSRVCIYFMFRVFKHETLSILFSPSKVHNWAVKRNIYSETTSNSWCTATECWISAKQINAGIQKCLFKKNERKFQDIIKSFFIFSNSFLFFLQYWPIDETCNACVHFANPETSHKMAPEEKHGNDPYNSNKSK